MSDTEKDRLRNRMYMRQKRAKMTPEEKEAEFKKLQEYFSRKYNSDPVFRMAYKLKVSKKRRERYRNDDEFRAKVNARTRKYYAEHREELAAKAREKIPRKKAVRLMYGIDSKDPKAYYKVWRDANREKMREYQRKYRLKKYASSGA